MEKRRPVKYCLVDAFTDSPFKGNPAAVCLLEHDRDDDWFLSVASEFNVSVTSFLTRIPAADSTDLDNTSHCFRLRWFTPIAEIELCGHSTLGSAHFLFTSGLVDTDEIEFLTLSGTLTAKRVHEADKSDSTELKNGQYLSSSSIELNFPAVSLVEHDLTGEDTIAKALNGCSVIEIKRTAAGDDLLVLLPSGKNVADFHPQFEDIQKCPGRGLIITGPAPTGSGFDFISRFFCPKLRVNEDPVCGGAHCALAPYWSKKLGKSDFVAYQASHRGGILNLHVDERNQRVVLRGKAVSIMEGFILV